MKTIDLNLIKDTNQFAITVETYEEFEQLRDHTSAKYYALNDSAAWKSGEVFEKSQFTPDNPMCMGFSIANNKIRYQGYCDKNWYLKEDTKVYQFKDILQEPYKPQISMMEVYNEY